MLRKLWTVAVVATLMLGCSAWALDLDNISPTSGDVTVNSGAGPAIVTGGSDASVVIAGQNGFSAAYVIQNMTSTTTAPGALTIGSGQTATFLGGSGAGEAGTLTIMADANLADSGKLNNQGRLVFGSGGYLTFVNAPVAGQVTNAGTITFSAGSTITGLTGSDIINNAGGTINADVGATGIANVFAALQNDATSIVNLTGSGTWSAGNITLDDGTLNTGAFDTFSSNVANAAGTVKLGSAPTVTFEGQLTANAVDYGAATKVVAKSAVAIATQTVIANGKTWEFDGVGSAHVAGNFDVQSGGTLTYGAGSAYGAPLGTLVTNAGTVNVDFANVGAFAAVATTDAAGEVNLTGAGPTTAAIAVNAGTTAGKFNTGDVTQFNAALGVGAMDLVFGGNATISFAPTAVVNVGGATTAATISAVPELNVNFGVNTVTATSMAVAASQTFSVDGTVTAAVTNAGTYVLGANAIASGAITNTGVLTVANGANLATNFAQIANDGGDILLTDAAYAGNMIVGSATNAGGSLYTGATTAIAGAINIGDMDLVIGAKNYELNGTNIDNGSTAIGPVTITGAITANSIAIGDLTGITEATFNGGIIDADSNVATGETFNYGATSVYTVGTLTNAGTVNFASGFHYSANPAALDGGFIFDNSGEAFVSFGVENNIGTGDTLTGFFAVTTNSGDLYITGLATSATYNGSLELADGVAGGTVNLGNYMSIAGNVDVGANTLVAGGFHTADTTPVGNRTTETTFGASVTAKELVYGDTVTALNFTGVQADSVVAIADGLTVDGGKTADFAGTVTNATDITVGGAATSGVVTFGGDSVNDGDILIVGNSAGMTEVVFDGNNRDLGTGTVKFDATSDGNFLIYQGDVVNTAAIDLSEGDNSNSIFQGNAVSQGDIDNTGNGSTVVIRDQAQMGAGTITTGAGNTVDFEDDALATGGAIVNNGGTVTFNNDSSLDGATVDNKGDLDFIGASTAVSGIINNSTVDGKVNIGANTVTGGDAANELVINNADSGTVTFATGAAADVNTKIVNDATGRVVFETGTTSDATNVYENKLGGIYEVSVGSDYENILLSTTNDGDLYLVDAAGALTDDLINNAASTGTTHTGKATAIDGNVNIAGTLNVGGQEDSTATDSPSPVAFAAGKTVVAGTITRSNGTTALEYNGKVTADITNSAGDSDTFKTGSDYAGGTIDNAGTLTFDTGSSITGSDEPALIKNTGTATINAGVNVDTTATTIENKGGGKLYVDTTNASLGAGIIDNSGDNATDTADLYITGLGTVLSSGLNVTGNIYGNVHTGNVTNVTGSVDVEHNNVIWGSGGTLGQNDVTVTVTGDFTAGSTTHDSNVFTGIFTLDVQGNYNVSNEIVYADTVMNIHNGGEFSGGLLTVKDHTERVDGTAGTAAGILNLAADGKFGTGSSLHNYGETNITIDAATNNNNWQGMLGGNAAPGTHTINDGNDAEINILGDDLAGINEKLVIADVRGDGQINTGDQTVMGSINMTDLATGTTGDGVLLLGAGATAAFTDQKVTFTDDVIAGIIGVDNSTSDIQDVVYGDGTAITIDASIAATDGVTHTFTEDATYDNSQTINAGIYVDATSTVVFEGTAGYGKGQIANEGTVYLSNAMTDATGTLGATGAGNALAGAFNSGDIYLTGAANPDAIDIVMANDPASTGNLYTGEQDKFDNVNVYQNTVNFGASEGGVAEGLAVIDVAGDITAAAIIGDDTNFVRLNIGGTLDTDTASTVNAGQIFSFGENAAITDQIVVNQGNVYISTGSKTGDVQADIVSMIDNTDGTITVADTGHLASTVITTGTFETGAADQIDGISVSAAPGSTLDVVFGTNGADADIITAITANAKQKIGNIAANSLTWGTTAPSLIVLDGELQILDPGHNFEVAAGNNVWLNSGFSLHEDLVTPADSTTLTNNANLLVSFDDLLVPGDGVDRAIALINDPDKLINNAGGTIIVAYDDDNPTPAAIDVTDDIIINGNLATGAGDKFDAITLADGNVILGDPSEKLNIAITDITFRDAVTANNITWANSAIADTDTITFVGDLDLKGDGVNNGVFEVLTGKEVYFGKDADISLNTTIDNTNSGDVYIDVVNATANVLQIDNFDGVLDAWGNIHLTDETSQGSVGNLVMDGGVLYGEDITEFAGVIMTDDEEGVVVLGNAATPVDTTVNFSGDVSVGGVDIDSPNISTVNFNGDAVFNSTVYGVWVEAGQTINFNEYAEGIVVVDGGIVNLQGDLARESAMDLTMYSGTANILSDNVGELDLAATNGIVRVNIEDAYYVTTNADPLEIGVSTPNAVVVNLDGGILDAAEYTGAIAIGAMGELSGNGVVLHDGGVTVDGIISTSGGKMILAGDGDVVINNKIQIGLVADPVSDPLYQYELATLQVTSGNVIFSTGSDITLSTDIIDAMYVDGIHANLIGQHLVEVADGSTISPANDWDYTSEPGYIYFQTSDFYATMKNDGTAIIFEGAEWNLGSGWEKVVNWWDRENVDVSGTGKDSFGDALEYVARNDDIRQDIRDGLYDADTMSHIRTLHYMYGRNGESLADFNLSGRDVISMFNSEGGQGHAAANDAVLSNMKMRKTYYKDRWAATADEVNALASVGVDGALASSIMNCNSANRVWVAGIGTWEDLDAKNNNATGYEYNTGGVMVGYDHWFGPVLVGAAFSWNGGDFDDHNALGNDSDIDNYAFEIYATYKHCSGFFASILGGYTYSDYDMRRYRAGINSTGTAATRGWEEADYHGDSWQIGGDLGYDWKITNCLTVTPSIGLYYRHTKSKSFTATYNGIDVNDGSMHTSYNHLSGIKNHSVEMPIELSVAYDLNFSNGSKMQLLVNGGYAYEFHNKGSKGTVVWGGIGNGVPSVSIAGRKPGRSTWNVGAGVKYDYGRFEFSAKYDYYTRSDLDAHRVYGGVGIKF